MYVEVSSDISTLVKLNQLYFTDRINLDIATESTLLLTQDATGQPAPNLSIISNVVS